MQKPNQRAAPGYTSQTPFGFGGGLDDTLELGNVDIISGLKRLSALGAGGIKRNLGLLPDSGIISLKRLSALGAGWIVATKPITFL